MKNKGIEDYILTRYKNIVDVWLNKLTDSVLRNQSLDKMILLEDVLANCFGYNIKHTDDIIELFKANNSIFKYKFK